MWTHEGTRHCVGFKRLLGRKLRNSGKSPNKCNFYTNKQLFLIKMWYKTWLSIEITRTKHEDNENLCSIRETLLLSTVLCQIRHETLKIAIKCTALRQTIYSYVVFESIFYSHDWTKFHEGRAFKTILDHRNSLSHIYCRLENIWGKRDTFARD